MAKKFVLDEIGKIDRIVLSANKEAQTITMQAGNEYEPQTLVLDKQQVNELISLLKLVQAELEMF